MQHSPLISILLPFKNASGWIEETIRSIVEQSYENWELIAVDDDSKDNSAGIIERFKDGRIQIFKNTGEGIIPALQLALEKSSGEFITRMDADDIIPPDKLSNLLSLVETSTERKVATGLVQYFSKGSVSPGYLKYEDWLNERCVKNDHFNHIYRECVVASPNWLVKKSFLVKDQIFNRLKYPEDYDMTFQWLKHGYEIVSSEQVTHLWREHPERTSRNSDIYQQKSFFQLKLKWFLELNPRINELAVFGAGPKGKLVIEILSSHLKLNWYDVQHEKFKSQVLGHTISDPEKCTEKFALIAVYPNELNSLENYLKSLDFEIGQNAWYV